MDESIFDKIPGLDELLKSKNFEELSDAEKSLILAYMSKEEYGDMRMPVRKASSLFADDLNSIAPDPEIRLQILERFNLKQKTEGANKGRKGILFYKIPAYQAGIAAVLLVCFALYLGSAWSKKREKIQLVDRTDTVFIEKLIPQSSHDEIAQVSMNPAKVSRQQIAGIPQGGRKINYKSDLPDTYSAQLRNVEQLVNMNRRAKQGRNAVDDSLLMKLLVTVN